MLNINNKLFEADTDADIKIDLDTNFRTSYEFSLKADFEFDLDFNHINKADRISGILVIEADKSPINKKKSIKTTNLRQLSELTILIKGLSIFILPNTKDFIL